MVTGFTASKEALAFLLRQLTDIRNEVPDEDGIREIVELWKNEDNGKNRSCVVRAFGLAHQATNLGTGGVTNVYQKILG